MFFHLIPLQELKQHSVTYWRPGRDNHASPDTWVVISELESGYETTVIDVPAQTDVDDVLAQFLRVKESVDRARKSAVREGRYSQSV